MEEICNMRGVKLTRILKNFSILIGFFFTVFFASNDEANAANYALPIGKVVTGELTESVSSNTYELKIDKAGDVRFSVNSYINGNYYIVLKDRFNEEIFREYGSSKPYSPNKIMKEVDLEPGTYYLTIKNTYSKVVGKYDITTMFTPANNSDIEPNNGTVNAQLLEFDMLTTGFLSWNDSEDYYKIVTSKAGKIGIQIDSFLDDYTEVRLIDDKNNEVFDIKRRSSSINPIKILKEIDLEPGTYYLQIYRDDFTESTGKYTIKTTFKGANNQDVEPNNGIVNAQLLTFNKTITGYLSWNDSIDTYKISTTKAGTVSFQIDSFIDTYTRVLLVDDENNEVFDISRSSSSINPLKIMEEVDLEPGTYYLKIYRSDYSDDTGKYTVKTTFVAANNHEKEPNNGLIQAINLPFNQTKTGFLSWNDSADFYKVTLPKSGEVSFSFDSYTSGTIYVDIINSKNQRIVDGSVWGNDYPNKRSFKKNLVAGTYYVKVYRSLFSDSSGKYNMRISATHLLPSLTVDTISDKSTTVKGKTNPYQEVVVKIQGKEYKKKADSRGTFSITIPKLKKGTKVEISVKNSYGTKLVTKIVVDKTAPSAPTVSTVANNSTTIKGKAEPNSVVYAKVGNKKIGEAKANSKGEYTIKIKKQNAGTTISVYAKDNAGNVSSTKKVKVVDKIAPSAPTVNKVTSKTKYVTGKAEKGSTVYIYKGSKFLGKATVKSNGTFSVKISAQKKGSTITIYVKDKAGNKSKSKSVKVN